MAAMPLTTDFFPDLEEQSYGIKGRSEKLASAAQKTVPGYVSTMATGP
jgi:hypothetical protein